MDIVNTAVTIVVLASIGFLLTRSVQGRIDDLKKSHDGLNRRLDRLEQAVSAARAEARADKEDLRRELRAEIQSLREEFRSELQALRGDLTQVALAVGIGRRPQTGNA